MSLPRCPSCGAAVRADAPWCSLCYTDLRPRPEPVAAPPRHARPDLDTGPDREPDLDPLTAPLELLLRAPGDPLPPPPAPTAGAARWPCTACGEQNPMEETTCAACGTAFLDGLRAEARPLLPGADRVVHLSRNARLTLALGLAVLVTVLVAALFLVGDILT